MTTCPTFPQKFPTSCRAVTGGGFETREFYTNADSVIFTFKHCVALNGVGVVAAKPDLLDRSLLFKMDRATGGRKDDGIILAEFNRLRPFILGDIFSVISAAMKIKPEIKIKELPRMADFALWGSAIAEVLGYGQEVFLAAYERNRNMQNEEVLQDSLVATVVRHFMQTRDIWKNTASQTLSALTELAIDLQMNPQKEKGWPTAANSLSRKLNELKTNLAEDGIKVDTEQKLGQSRAILLVKVTANTVLTVKSSENPNLSQNSGGYTINDLKYVSPGLPSAINPLIPSQKDATDDTNGISADHTQRELLHLSANNPSANSSLLECTGW